MLRERKETARFRFSGILLCCMILFGSLLLVPAEAQAGRGGRHGRNFARSGRRSERFDRHWRHNHRPDRRHQHRHHHRHHRRHYRRHYRRTNWVNFGWTLGNAAWSAVNLANTYSNRRASNYYNRPVVVERPVYIVRRSYEDDTDYQILRDWDYTPNTTTTRTEIIITP